MVYNPNSIDIMGQRNDGGIELYIITKDGLDESAEQQTLLLDKIENYMAYLNGKDFKEEFPCIADEKRWIILKVDKQPSEMMKELLVKISDWVRSEGIHFRIVEEFP